MTPQRFFDEVVPKLLEGRAKLAQAVTFHIVGEQGGTWTLDDGVVTAKDDTNAALRITIADIAFTDLMTGAADAETLIREGGMVIQGDTALLTPLSFLFEPPLNTWQRQ